MLAILNISGRGIPGIMSLNWQNPCMDDRVGNCNPLSFSPVFQVDVLKGEGRLIQILAVRGDDSSDSSEGKTMVFHYGDTTASLNQDSMSVDVPISQVGSSIEQAEFTGRIYGPQGELMTGRISQFFNVGSGKPKMLIMNSEIFSGWVDHITVLKGASFDLVYADSGATLINNLNLGDGTAAGGILRPGAHLLTIKAPAMYKSWGGNSSVWRNGARTSLVGLVGGGNSSSRRVCYDGTLDLFDHLYKDINLTSHVSWNGNDSSDPTAMYVSSGGFASTLAGMTTDCADPSVQLQLDTLGLENSISTAIGILGPFSIPAAGQDMGGGSFVAVDWNATPKTVNWNFAPQVDAGENPIAGITLFSYRYPDSTDPNSMGSSEPPFRRHGMNDGYDCRGLAEGAYSGAIKVGDFNLNQTSFSLPAAMTDTELSRTIYIACPFRPKFLVVFGHEYFTKGVQSYGGMRSGGNNNCQNCNNPHPIATQISIYDYKNSPTSALSGYGGVCIPFRIKGQIAGGSYGQIPTGAQFQIAVSGLSSQSEMPQFFRSSDCNTNNLNSGVSCGSGSSYTCTISPVMPNFGMGQDIVFYMIPGSSANLSLSISDITSSIQNPTATVALNMLSASPNADKIVVASPSNPLYAYSCQPVELYTINSSTGVLANPSYGSNVNLPSIAGFNFYQGDDWKCSGAAVTGVTYNSSTQLSLTVNGPAIVHERTVVHLRMKYQGTATSLMLTPSGVGGSITTSESATVTVSQPGAASSLTLEGSFNNNGNYQFARGECQNFEVAFWDQQGHASPLPGAIILELTDNGGGSIFQGVNCVSTGSGSLSLTVPVGSTRHAFSYKNMSIPNTTGTLSMAANSYTGNTAKNVNYTILAPVANHLKIILPGQSQSEVNGVGSIIGTPLPLGNFVSTLGKVFIYALTSAETIDLNFNQSLPFTLSVNFPFNINSSMLNFSSGVASLDIVPNLSSLSGTYMMQISATGSNGMNYSGGSSMFSVVPVGKFNLFSPPSLQSNNCRAILISTTDSSGSAYRAPTNPSLNLTFSGQTMNGVFSDSACTSPLNSNSFMASDAALVAYVKTSMTSGSSTLIVNSSSMPFGSVYETQGSFTWSLGNISPQSIDRINVYGMPSIKANVCQPYLISVEDANSQSQGVGSATSVTLADGSGNPHFFTDSQCSSPISSGITTIASGTVAAVVYYKNDLPGAYTLNARANSSSPTLTAGSNLSVAVTAP